jgi:chromosomal replication initiator protein
LVREMTAAPLTQIGQYFGGRDHTTVLYACRKVAEDIHKSAYLAQAAREVRAMLRG